MRKILSFIAGFLVLLSLLFMCASVVQYRKILFKFPDIPEINDFLVHELVLVSLLASSLLNLNTVYFNIGIFLEKKFMEIKPNWETVEIVKNGIVRRGYIDLPKNLFFRVMDQDTFDVSFITGRIAVVEGISITKDMSLAVDSAIPIKETTNIMIDIPNLNKYHHYGTRI